MKISKKLKTDLEDILYRLEACQKFIENDKVIIAIKSSGTTADEFVNNKTGDYIAPITKFIGSELNQLLNAKRELLRILKTEN